MDGDLIKKSILDFSYFIGVIFPQSFKSVKPARHLIEWAKRIQHNKKTATLSARGHLKSNLMYAYMMWRILRMRETEEWLYMSYTDRLSRYHVRKIKQLIRANPFFKGLIDLTNAESSINYTWDNNTFFNIMPASILRFNRGWHGYGVICDDILSDPTSTINFTIIQTINQTFFEEVMSLPNPEGELHLVGTAQHEEDLFFKIKEKDSNFNWAVYPAIINEIEKKVLWPEKWPYELLIDKRDKELGEKAFRKEFLCSPVWSEDVYFKREEIMKLIDSGLQNLNWVENKLITVIAGLDIGKVRHPSHFTVFMHAGGLIVQIYQIFMDNWDYTKQVEYINSLIDRLKIKRIYYDDTRSELESFAEQGIIRRGLWTPVKFTQTEKFKIAANFSKVVSKGVLRLQNNQRMIRSILSVNNNLEAIETIDGHGDAFWSIAMALNHKEMGPIAVAGANRWD